MWCSIEVRMGIHQTRCVAHVVRKGENKEEPSYDNHIEAVTAFDSCCLHLLLDVLCYPIWKRSLLFLIALTIQDQCLFWMDIPPALPM